MAEGNSTTENYTRRPISPELWIPYVMIGVSCVIFLAVHFWCYHKRNRERYLRKRDEKRVKSGLLERRRITTLMLARYQSDLGISQSETDVDLTQDVLFYDNSSEVFLNDSDSNINKGARKSYTFQNADGGAVAAALGLATTVASNSPGGTSDNASFGATGKTLPNSQTWPRVTERKPKSYNAHVGCIQYDGAAGAVGEAGGGGGGGCDHKPVVLMDYDEGDNSMKEFWRASQPPDYQTAIVHCSDIPREVSNREPLTTINSMRETASEIPQTSAAYVEKSALPPTTYPNVFYTNLNTPYDNNSTLFKPYRSSQKKRRHDGAPVEDNEITGHCGKSSSLAYEQENANRPQGNSEKERTHPYTISGTDRHRLNYIYGNNDNQFCPIRTSNTSDFGISKDEAFPFAGAGHAYGSIRHDSESADAQMIPLTEIRRNLPNQMHDMSLRKHGHDGQPYVVHGQDSIGAESSTDIDVELLESNTQPPSRIYKPQHVVIPISDRSVLNMISKTPGKIRSGNIPGEDSSNAWTTSKPGPLARMDTFDTSGSDPELQNYDDAPGGKDAQQSKVQHVPKQEQIHTQTVSPGVSVVKDIPSACEANTIMDNTLDKSSALSNNNSTHPGSTEDGVIPVQTHISSHPPLQTPSLRGLDPKLVFHHTKRKLGAKSDLNQTKQF